MASVSVPSRDAVSRPDPPPEQHSKTIDVVSDEGSPELGVRARQDDRRASLAGTVPRDPIRATQAAVAAATSGRSHLQPRQNHADPSSHGAKVSD
jgi:hypothetical protein